jgi:hypothetical protein
VLSEDPRASPGRGADSAAVTFGIARPEARPNIIVWLRWSDADGAAGADAGSCTLAPPKSTVALRALEEDSAEGAGPRIGLTAGVPKVTGWLGRRAAGAGASVEVPPKTMVFDVAEAAGAGAGAGACGVTAPKTIV